MGVVERARENPWWGLSAVKQQCVATLAATRLPINLFSHNRIPLSPSSVLSETDRIHWYLTFSPFSALFFSHPLSLSLFFFFPFIYLFLSLFRLISLSIYISILYYPTLLPFSPLSPQRRLPPFGCVPSCQSRRVLPFGLRFGGASSSSIMIRSVPSSAA